MLGAYKIFAKIKIFCAKEISLFFAFNRNEFVQKRLFIRSKINRSYSYNPLNLKEIQPINHYKKSFAKILCKNLQKLNFPSPYTSLQ